jgi:glyoxylase-like metal-dependent hydrolase (beta-lactamase superfamily II)
MEYRAKGIVRYWCLKMLSINKIDDKIYFLKGNRSSNIFYFDFEKKALIDTGHPDEIDQNLKTFKDNGIDLKKIDYIINTHSHGDHVGANAALKKINPEIKIIGSINTIDFQKKRRSLNILKEVEDNFDDYEIDIKISDNYKIDLGGCVLESIETKGHTSDSISYYTKEKGYLFCGDTIYYRVITQLDYYQKLILSLEDLEKTYDKLKTLSPKIIFTGHGDSINDPLENFEYCFKKLNRFKKDMEIILINNMIPTVEFYIFKTPDCSKEEVKKIIVNNLIKFKDAEFLNDFDPERFDKIFEKMFSLMKLLNIINENDNKLSLTRKLNEYIGIIKI